MPDAAPHRSIIVVPSILSADFGRLAEEVRAVAATTTGPTVMVGTKRPSITSPWIQSAPAASVRRCTQKPLVLAIRRLPVVSEAIRAIAAGGRLEGGHGAACRRASAALRAVRLARSMRAIRWNDVLVNVAPGKDYNIGVE